MHRKLDDYGLSVYSRWPAVDGEWLSPGEKKFGQDDSMRLRRAVTEGPFVPCRVVRRDDRDSRVGE